MIYCNSLNARAPGYVRPPSPTGQDNDRCIMPLFSQNIDENEENYSYTEPSGSPTSSPTEKQLQELDVNDPSRNTEIGINTQNELAEKLEFFKQLEQEKSNLDYGKLNELLDIEGTSCTDRVRADDLLQATGVELGNSIFNATGNGYE